MWRTREAKAEVLRRIPEGCHEERTIAFRWPDLVLAALIERNSKPMIPVTPEISLDESEISERFIRASGPGGQNVNKVSTAVQLRFDARNSPSLPEDVRERLELIAGGLVTDEGVLVITAQRFRTQDRNRMDALARLIDLIQRAAEPPVPRRATKTPVASRLKRLESKRHRSAVKSLRSDGGMREE
jgi:ribosome-associated protein